MWLGLKNSDDQGTRFDLRAEVYLNGALLSSGETLCITDITRNANQAKEVAVSFGGFNPTVIDGAVDSLSVKILTRVGTDGAGNHCGGHSNAVGLRLYFDSTTRPAKFGAVTSVASQLPSLAIEPNPSLSLVSLPMPKELHFVSDAPRNLAALQSGPPLIIDYTYDALRRLKHADYSDGRDFAYTYDSNGNTLEAVQDTGSGPINTTFTYDNANQLLTAQIDSAVWYYVYDANGSLVQVLPDGNEATDAKGYTYNSAGYLVKVEAHNGADWNTQAEMTYNGLGTRLTTSALGITTQYASDGLLPLTIITGNNATTILYGLGPAAEKMAEWNYVLNDGYNLPRQLTDMEGEVTLSVRYSPWGKPIETDGIGNFNTSFIGTLIDASTGLIYIGDGQYYDPETGRFLTRGMNPDGTNPYLPQGVDPSTIFLGPLGLMVMSYRRKYGKRSEKTEPWVILLIIALMIFSIGQACIACAPAPAEVIKPKTETPPATSTSAAPATEPPVTPSPAPSPTPTPMLPTHCYCENMEYHSDDEWASIARVIKYEGATSFKDDTLRKRVFERQLWALRSIKQRQQSWRTYNQLVQDCEFMSACEEYNPDVEGYFRDTAKAILSEKRYDEEPPEFREKIIHWISAQNFPRYNTSNLVKGNEVVFYTNSSELTKCGVASDGCQLNDMRSLEWVRSYQIKSLTMERFIDLGRMGPYQSGYDSWVKLKQEAEELYGQKECYWVGVYFIHDSDWTTVKAGHPLPPATLNETRNLQCQSYTPITN